VTVLRRFVVFCGVLQMFCERCFVQYSRFFWLSENARNTRAYCEFFVFSVFFDVFQVFCVFCGNTAKHSQNTAKHPQNTTKHPQNTTKHHKTHLLTKQPEFANKPALAHSRQPLLTSCILPWVTTANIYIHTYILCISSGAPAELPV